MRYLYNIIWLPLFILFFSRCNKSESEIYRIHTNQEIYFQHEYINHAWGYHHSGWLIDSAGYVFCYNKPTDWIFPDSTGLITIKGMNMNLSKVDSICFQIDKNELNDKISLIQKSASGQISKPFHEMADAGVSANYGFLFDNTKNTYKQILLGQSGDFRIENDSEAANELQQWLNDMDKKIRK